MIEKIKISSLLLFGFLPIYLLYNLFHTFSFEKTIIYLFYLIITLFVFFMAAFGKHSDKTKYTTYLYGGAALFFIILNLGIFLFYNYKLNSENLIMVEKDSIQIQFKKNGDCISKQKCDEKYHYSYGDYQLTDDVIIVDGKGFDKDHDIKFIIKDTTIQLISNDKQKREYNTFDIIKDITIQLISNDKQKREYNTFDIIEDNRKSD